MNGLLSVLRSRCTEALQLTHQPEKCISSLGKCSVCQITSPAWVVSKVSRSTDLEVLGITLKDFAGSCKSTSFFFPSTSHDDVKVHIKRLAKSKKRKMTWTGLLWQLDDFENFSNFYTTRAKLI